VFAEGMQSLAENLAAGLDIRFGHIVRRIEHGRDGVRVTTSQGTVKGDVALVTLPLDGAHVRGPLTADVERVEAGALLLF